MYGLSVVIAQKDASCAQKLAHEFGVRTRHVELAQSEGQLREAVTRSHAQAAIVDLELLDPHELHHLCEELRSTAIIVTHRSPDEEMWMETLQCGAVDCCQCSDVEGMMRAISHNVRLAKRAAA